MKKKKWSKFLGLEVYREVNSRNISWVFYKTLDGHRTEVYLNRKPKLFPKFSIYQTPAEHQEGQGVHSVRLQFAWLWLSINAYLMTRPGAVNDWDSSAPNQPKEWGFYSLCEGCPREIVFHWGNWSLYWNAPFLGLEFVDHYVLDQKQNPIALVPRTGNIFASDIANEHRVTEKHPFTYVLKKSDEVQRTIATCFIERRRWKRKWLPKWLLPHIKTYVDIQFADEMGNERGSWKGGTVGCSCDIKPGETIYQALKRYEKTANFCKSNI